MDPTKMREAAEAARDKAGPNWHKFYDMFIALCDQLAAATARAEAAEAERDQWKDAADRYAADMIESGFKLRQAREALEKIARWELPPTGQKWEDGSPVSYATLYGSNGERDFIRETARAALTALSQEAKDGE